MSIGYEYKIWTPSCTNQYHGCSKVWSNHQATNVDFVVLALMIVLAKRWIFFKLFGRYKVRALLLITTVLDQQHPGSSTVIKFDKHNSSSSSKISINSIETGTLIITIMGMGFLLLQLDKILWIRMVTVRDVFLKWVIASLNDFSNKIENFTFTHAITTSVKHK